MLLAVSSPDFVCVTAKCYTPVQIYVFVNNHAFKLILFACFGDVNGVPLPR